MEKTIDIARAKCTSLAMQGPVTLAQDSDDGADFEINAYTGQAVDRWWGKLAIAVDGITAKQKMPILLNHDGSKIVGFSMENRIDDNFIVTGKFSKSTEAAKETKNLAEEGFPWQASIGVRPLTIVEIKSGSTMLVNGVLLDGPAEIWVESEVYETSFVPLGADSNTSVAMLTRVEEMAQGAATKKELVMEFSLESLRKEAPELLGQLQKDAREEGVTQGMAAGAEAELKRIESVFAQSFPGHEDLVKTAMFDGKSQAGDVAMAINAANIEAQAKAGQDLSSDAPPAVPEHAGTVLRANSKDEDDERTLNAICQEKWDNTKSTREEFGTFDVYLAYKEAEASKSFKYLRNKEAK